ncbi:MAG: SH3 domain-containing protein [Anaerolineales bacterium]|nr:SH3 domain-containing protein [Anaerolineales bacterium]
MDRDTRIALLLLVVIGIVVYGAGLTIRSFVGRDYGVIPTVAVLPTLPPSSTPTETPPPTFTPDIPPTETPTATFTGIPTEISTDAPIETSDFTPSPEMTGVLAGAVGVVLPTDPVTETAAALINTEIAFATAAHFTAVAATAAVTLTPQPTTLLPPTPHVTPPSPPPAPTLTPTMPLPTPSEITAVVLADRGLLLRTGPGKEYAALATILKGAVVDVRSRTEDSAWVSVEVRGTIGWMSAEFLQFSADVGFVPIEGAEVIAALPKTRPCISVVGDSLAYGEVIFELPGVGFIKVKMSPFSDYIRGELETLRAPGYEVRDRSYPGTGISSPKHLSFYETSIYQDLLRDRCAFTIVLPWVNDLSSGVDPAVSAEEHARRLTEFATRLLQNNPQGKIVFGNYYFGAPAPFSSAMAYGFTPNAITLFNQSMKAACTLGELSKMPNVLCIDVAPAFQEVGSRYVVGQMPRSEVDAMTTRRLTPDEQNLLEYYSRTFPGAPLNGDGIHLSSLGKRLLANYLLKVSLKLN